MKKSNKLGIWKVWNEYITERESVFIDHKPTKEEILEIFRLEGWGVASWVDKDWFVETYIHIEPLKVYQSKK